MPSRTSRPRRERALAVVAAALLAAACGRRDFTMVAVVPQTGELAPYGLEIRRGIELATAELNAAGAGPTIALRIVDDGSDPVRAVAEVKAALESDPVAVLGPVGNAAFVEVGPLADQSGLAVLSPWASASIADLGYRNLFRCYPSDGLETSRLVKLIRKDLFLKDLVLVSETTDYGRWYKAAFHQSFERLRGTIQASKNFAPGISRDDALRLVEELRTKPGQGVLVIATGRDAVTIVQALRAIDYTGEVFTTSAFHHEAFRTAAGEAAQDVMYVAPAFDPGAPDAAPLTSAYRKAHGADPTLWAALGHDSVKVIADAVASAGGLYTTEVPPTLRSATFESKGALGSTKFDASGDCVRDLDVFGVRDGQALAWDRYEPYWQERNPTAGAEGTGG
jgi:branched-chain amino acid transport system substrate-binding protein